MAQAKILVVDDEANILDLVTAYLKPEGYEVRTAADGVAGLDLARSFQPDVIVLDVMLPGIDGLEVLARLRRESGAYVILLTSKSEETDKIVGLSVGADDYVTKPFSVGELLARIRARNWNEALPVGNGRLGAMVFGGIEKERLQLNEESVWTGEPRWDATTGCALHGAAACRAVADGGQ